MQPSTLPINFFSRLTLAPVPFQRPLYRCASRLRDKSSILRSLRALILSCRSFCKSNPFFSIACGLFVQNTRGWGCPSAPCSSATNQFVAPLFSWSYELLFAQPFHFEYHLRCPPGVGVRPPSSQQERCCSFRHGGN